MMKTQIYFVGLLLFLSVIFLPGCKKDSDTTVSPYVYMHKTEISKTFDVADNIDFSATLVGADYPTALAYPENDVTVHFKVDASQIARYNKQHGTNYKELPAANYSFQASGTILKGSLGTSGLNLEIHKGDALEAFSTYLLPLTIDKVDGAELSDTQQTTFFVLTRTPSLGNLPHFDRSKWSIAGFSTQEPGEGDGTNNNGLAIAALDGNIDSYWHSKWDPDDVPPPHYIAVDMGEVKLLHGISYVCRQVSGDWAVNGHGQPKVMTISISTDGIDWTDTGTFNLSLPPVGSPEAEVQVALPNVEARYFRLTVTSAWAAPGTSIAEIYAL